MTAALTPRCHVCGSRLGPLEPAVVPARVGTRAEVCVDGYACAVRANAQREGKARFVLVTSPVTAERDAGPATPRNR